MAAAGLGNMLSDVVGIGASDRIEVTQHVIEVIEECIFVSSC